MIKTIFSPWLGTILPFLTLGSARGAASLGSANAIDSQIYRHCFFSNFKILNNCTVLHLTPAGFYEINQVRKSVGSLSIYLVNSLTYIYLKTKAHKNIDILIQTSKNCEKVRVRGNDFVQVESTNQSGDSGPRYFKKTEERVHFPEAN